MRILLLANLVVAAHHTEQSSAGRANRCSFKHIAHITALVPGLFHRTFASLDFRTIRAGQTIEDARYFHHLPVGKNHGGKVQIELRPALDPARPLHPGRWGRLTPLRALSCKGTAVCKR